MSNTNQQKIAIIGLGVVGRATYEDMMDFLQGTSGNLFNKTHLIYGVDLKETILSEMSDKYKWSKYFGGLSKKIMHDMDVYIISVYSPEQIEIVFEQIPKKNNPLIIVESTVPPKLSQKLLKSRGNAKLALFPHRYNPNDPEHRVFNLSRVLGAADEESMKDAVSFYTQFMDNRLIKKVPYFIAALSKPAENAYRYLEIAIAEDWKMECDRLGVDFNELRKSMNTKWNIELKEARDGIGGMCLPKDTSFMRKYFSKSKLIATAMEVDSEYRKKYGKKK